MPFKRPDYVAGDPTAVESSVLRCNFFAIHQTAIHQPGIKRHMIFDRGKRWGRLWIAPGRFACGLFAYYDVEVDGLPLPLTPRAALCRQEIFAADIRRWNVIDGRMACLQHASGAPGISN